MTTNNKTQKKTFQTRNFQTTRPRSNVNGKVPCPITLFKNSTEKFCIRKKSRTGNSRLQQSTLNTAINFGTTSSRYYVIFDCRWFFTRSACARNVFLFDFCDVTQCTKWFENVFVSFIFWCRRK